MTVADYYPKKDRIDFLDDKGMPCGGIYGDRAHIKAAALIMSNNAIVRICGINSKMNTKWKTKLEWASHNRKTKSLNLKS